MKLSEIYCSLLAHIISYWRILPYLSMKYNFKELCLKFLNDRFDSYCSVTLMVNIRVLLTQGAIYTGEKPCQYSLCDKTIMPFASSICGSMAKPSSHYVITNFACRLASQKLRSYQLSSQNWTYDNHYNVIGPFHCSEFDFNLKPLKHVKMLLFIVRYHIFSISPASG